jgi:hypothetical protein
MGSAEAEVKIPTKMREFAYGTGTSQEECPAPNIPAAMFAVQVGA